MNTDIKLSMRIATLLILAGSALLAGCSFNSAQSASITGGTVTASPEVNIVIDGSSTPVIVNTLPTPTIGAPTATTKPANLAARVNGQDITLEQLNAELARYMAADPASPSPDSADGKQLATQLKDSVLETLIDQTLIDQEAARNKINVTDKQVNDEINALIQIRGGQDKYEAWLQANKQSEQDVREAVRHELIATAMRDRIVAQLPHTAEYVHAYHIVVATEAEANTVLAKLHNGARFTALAQQISIDASTRPDGGDLGWFTRGTGTVLWPEVEDAAFSLKAGQLSDIVHSPIGYHIIKVVERQTRALTPDDLTSLEQTALDQWIVELKTKSTIERFI
jgi:parvulin-like peptidyl-prolyl isomerase